MVITTVIHIFYLIPFCKKHDVNPLMWEPRTDRNLKNDENNIHICIHQICSSIYKLLNFIKDKQSVKMPNYWSITCKTKQKSRNVITSTKTTIVPAARFEQTEQLTEELVCMTCMGLYNGFSHKVNSKHFIVIRITITIFISIDHVNFQLFLS